MSAAAFLLAAGAFGSWRPENLTTLSFYIVGAVLAAHVSIPLPRVASTTSMSFVFVLTGIIEFGPAEAILIGWAGMLAETFRGPRSRWSVPKLPFNLASITLAAGAGHTAYHAAFVPAVLASLPIRLIQATAAYFFVNTVSVAIVIALTERKSTWTIWRAGFLWIAPEHLAGTALAAVIHTVNLYIGRHAALLSVPLVYLVYRSYALYLDRLNREREHAAEIADLHWRTIEALALVIGAKDDVTHDHVRRVQVYATEIGKELGLAEDEMKALEVASLLHDIGKLAISEQILCKPGKLTPEEFEIMKTHPVIGAEILQRVEFPFPVVPIVRSHHEKWDGSGYPFGLRGADIPIGARILAPVDCLDALASDRQYRRAMPLDKAMERVAAESGRSFDPRVVEILQRRYVELELMARAKARPASKLAIPKMKTGGAPAAGFEVPSPPTDGAPVESTDVLVAIASARQDFQSLLDMSAAAGSLPLTEMLALISVPFKRFIPHHAIVIYILRSGALVPEFVSGEDYRLFSALRLPLGRGISGWVAENRRPIVNGDPSVESAYLNDPNRHSSMRSALAIPLEGPAGVLGVVTLYHAAPDHFTRGHVRILLAVCPKAALIVQQALEQSAGAHLPERDELTGLPNARALFLGLEKELSRCRRGSVPLVVLTFDIDHFRDLNVALGRTICDRILQSAARALEANCRDYDLVARVGGDEFVAVLPGSFGMAASVRARELCEAIESAVAGLCDPQPFSISSGQAAFPEDGLNPDELLAEVDRSLYRAKWLRHDSGVETRP